MQRSVLVLIAICGGAFGAYLLAVIASAGVPHATASFSMVHTLDTPWPFWPDLLRSFGNPVQADLVGALIPWPVATAAAILIVTKGRHLQDQKARGVTALIALALVWLGSPWILHAIFSDSDSLADAIRAAAKSGWIAATLGFIVVAWRSISDDGDSPASERPPTVVRGPGIATSLSDDDRRRDVEDGGYA